MDSQSSKMTNLAYPVRLPHYETEGGAALLRLLARYRGVSQTALLRLLVREEAARAGVSRQGEP